MTEQPYNGCVAFKRSSSCPTYIDDNDEEKPTIEGDNILENKSTDRNNNGDDKILETNNQRSSSSVPHDIHWEDEMKKKSMDFFGTTSDKSKSVFSSTPTASTKTRVAGDSVPKPSGSIQSKTFGSDLEALRYKKCETGGSFIPSLTFIQSKNEHKDGSAITRSQGVQPHSELIKIDSGKPPLQIMNESNYTEKSLPEENLKTELRSGLPAEEDEEINPENNENVPRKSRFRSVQLSSLRTFPTNHNSKLRVRIGKKNAKYGHRLVEKDGSSNVEITGCERIDFYQRYFSDIFTTLIDSSWTFVLFITTAVYIGHWIIFGFFYWLFALYNNDYQRIMELQESPANQTDPCVYNVFDLTSAFLFSLESETTIGYGTRTVTTQCPHAVILLTLQCVVSAVFDTWVIGMCFARLARPDARTITTMFSKNAVICKRDGKKCLLIRFANLRKSLLLNVTVRARLISTRAAIKNEKSDGYQKMLEERQVIFHNSSCPLLTAPVEYCHVIDNDSPFYGVKSEAFNSPDNANYFELVFIVTGTLESTGLTMHAQTSYLSSEILYGHRFVPIITKSYEKEKYVVDFNHFHNTRPEMPVSIKLHPLLQSSPSRNVSAPLIEETEEEVLSTNDEVFTSGYEATITSVL